MFQTKYLTLAKLPNTINLQVFNKSNHFLPMKWLPGFGIFAYPTYPYKCFLLLKFCAGCCVLFFWGKASFKYMEQEKGW